MRTKVTENPENIAVIGASGTIGSALTDLLVQKYPGANLHAFSQDGELLMDYGDEGSIAEAAELVSREKPLDMVLVATGILHQGEIMPERALRELSAEKFRLLFEANTIVPALIAKHFLAKMSREKTIRFAALSARVGSISDNHLGGWYAYRASKAALNMVIKNAAIEIGRKNKKAIIVGLHPGTVDSPLSKPFQRSVPAGQLFEPQYSAERLLEVLEDLGPEHSGRCFAWDGEEILP